MIATLGEAHDLGWHLKEDDRAIFTAASKASQAAEYLRQFSETAPHEETEQAA